MSDVPATPPAEPTEEQIEKAKANMAGTPMAPAAEPAEAPPGMEEQATQAGNEIAARYVPPPPPPSIIEQLEKMKGEAPAPAPEPAPTP